MNPILQIFLISALLLFSLYPQFANTESSDIRKAEFPDVSFIPPSEYGQHPQNWNVSVSENGFLYFSNLHGVLRFDGYSWKLFEIDQPLTRLHHGSDGTLYAALQNDFGILEYDRFNNLIFTSILDQISELNHEFRIPYFIDTFQLAEIDEMVYLITNSGALVYNKQNPMLSEVFVNNSEYILDGGDGLVLLQKESGETFFAGRYKDASIETKYDADLPLFAGIFNRSESSWILAGQFGEIYEMIKISETSFLISKASESVAAEFDYLDDELIYDFNRTETHIVILTVDNGVFLTSHDGVVTGHYTTANGLESNFFFASAEDKSHNIWITSPFGIARININPLVSLIDRRSGILGNIWSVSTLENRLFIATSSGVYTSEIAIDGEIGELTNLGLSDLLYDYGDLRLLRPFPDKEEVLYLITSYALMQYNPSSANFEHVSNDIHDALFTSSTFKGTLFGSNNVRHLVLVSLNEELKVYKPPFILENFFSSPVMDIVEDEKGNILLSTFSDELFYLELLTYAQLKELPQNEQEHFILIDEDKGIRLHQLCGSNSEFDSSSPFYVVGFQDKIFVLNGTNVFIPKVSQTGPPQITMHEEEVPSPAKYLDLLASDSEAFWFIRERNNNLEAGIEFVNSANRSQNELGKNRHIFDIQPNYTSRLIPLNSGQRIILVNFSSLYVLNKPENSIQRKLDFELLITDARVYSDAQKAGNSVSKSRSLPANISTYNPIRLSYSENNIGFEVASNLIGSNRKIEHSFFLEGHDRGFTPFSNRNFENYSQLREGKYTLIVRSRLPDGSIYESSLASIIIDPPFYRTYFAYLIYLLLTISLVYGIVWLRSKNLEEQKKKLKFEVSKKTEALNKQSEILKEQKTRLEQANLLKVRLLRMTAHDLRNPLTALLGYSHLMQMETEDPQLKEYAETIHEISVRMKDIIQSMLATGARNLEQIELQLEQFDLNSIIKKSITQNAIFMKDKGQNAVMELYPGLIPILADKIRVHEIIDNILSNAVKYSPNNSTITIKTSLITNNSVVCINICDEGPGFTEDDKKKAFREYQRLSANANSDEENNFKDYSSFGLGLFIINQLVTAHAGKIEIDKNPAGRGTCFKVNLPLAP
ncbi:MAG: HAMP domain-containing histidine kinase [Balneolales bacterium]|nr:HAMP domain-containing histidine kinase [Balneolales bacterium]